MTPGMANIMHFIVKRKVSEGGQFRFFACPTAPTAIFPFRRRKTRHCDRQTLQFLVRGSRQTGDQNFTSVAALEVRFYFGKIPRFPHKRRSQNGLLDNNLSSSYPISVLSTAIDRSRRVESSHATPRTGGTRKVDFLSFLASKYDRFSVGSKNRTSGY